MFYASNEHSAWHGDGAHVMERYTGLRAQLPRFQSSLSPAWASDLTAVVALQVKQGDGNGIVTIAVLLWGLHGLMITKHLEQCLINSREEFPNAVIIITTTSLTLSKLLSSVGLNFPTGDMMGWMNLSQEDPHQLNSSIILRILLQLSKSS